MNTDQETLNFCCEKGYLDILTLKYRWFGDSASEIRKQTQFYGHTHSCDTKDLQEVYSTIRDLQKEQDWKQRSRLSIFAIFKIPWKDVKWDGIFFVLERPTLAMFLQYRKRTSPFC